jgi:bifunctional DNA-binding transcriptional regulator/antitoxin component of YhaV-PrlF toxin-antitoxin module
LRKEFGIEGGDEVRIESEGEEITIRTTSPAADDAEDASRAAQWLSRNAIANRYGDDRCAHHPDRDDGPLPDLGENA